MDEWLNAKARLSRGGALKIKGSEMDMQSKPVAKPAQIYRYQFQTELAIPIADGCSKAVQNLE